MPLGAAVLGMAVGFLHWKTGVRLGNFIASRNPAGTLRPSVVTLLL